FLAPLFLLLFLRFPFLFFIRCFFLVSFPGLHFATPLYSAAAAEGYQCRGLLVAVAPRNGGKS
ncbi:hypothetical protein, partial [Klebsiella pneumoniae]|uniref:hypothetical protein n=1 Tax=Klebsiella pneumoniae TaxID=573 RepID=UPI001F4A2FBB